MSCILILSLVLSTTVSVFAYTDTTEKKEASSDAEVLLKKDLGTEFLQPKLIETVKNDLNILSSKLFSDDFSIERMEADGNFLYKQTYPSGGITYFTVNEDKSGNTRLDCFEGDKHDQLVYTPDGKLFLDGFEIIPEIIEEDIPSISTSEFSIAPRSAGFVNTYTALSISSVPAGYRPVHKGTTSANLPFGKPLVKMTTGGLTGVLGNGVINILMHAAFLAGGWQAALAGVLTVGAGYAADRMIHYMKYLGAAYANSTSASFNGQKYFKENSSIAPRYIYEFNYYSMADTLPRSYTNTSYVLQEQDPR